MSMIRTARRLDDIAPFHAMAIMARAKAMETAGERVVHFEVGEPDFETAAPIVEAAHRGLDAGVTKYTQALGIPALRARIARYYADTAGVSVDAGRIVITSGASGGLMLACAALLDPDTELLLTDPGYPCNEAFVNVVGARPVRIPTLPVDGFQLRADAIRAHWGERVRGLLLGTPANPTGVVTPRRELLDIISAVRDNQGFVILDEIYQGLIYTDPPEYLTGLQLDDDVIVINSFSKYFGMTGWRLGWMVLPEPLMDGVERLAQNLYISSPSIAQHAALEAFEAPAMAIHQERRNRFAERRDLLCDGLTQLGLSVPVRPQGAFYLYVDVSATGMDARDFCWRLLNEFQVAVTPGIDFGDHNADRFVRFAYTTGRDSILLGLERLGTALSSWGIACG